MKKEKKKKLDNSEFKPLSDELGIEPPKIYRSEQRQRINADYYEQKDKSNKSSNKEKKPKQKRKLKNKYRKILYSLVIFIFIALVLTILSLTVLFKIETITVEGNQKYKVEQIIENTPIEYQSNLFLADTKNAKQMLETNLPYIYEATIKRKIPSKIEIIIKEADSFYTAKDSDSTYILMDNNFKVLEKGLDTSPEQAILIDNLAIKSVDIGHTLGFADSGIKDSLTKVNNMVKELRIVEITSIYATDSNHNYAVYDDRLVINLGKANDLENKLYAALAIIEKLENTNPMVEGEVNVANGKQYYFTENK